MTDARERNFNTYILGDNPAELADGLLVEIAEASGYELELPVPGEENLQNFVGHVGPGKWLQDNIELIRERLKLNGDATTVAADWADRSGMLLPMARGFSSPEEAMPHKVDEAFITGGVGRWMLRRVTEVVGQVEQGLTIGRLWLPVGTRVMKETEHDHVAHLMTELGQAPTEKQFAANVLLPLLGGAGVHVELLPEIDTADGDEIMHQFVGDHPEVLDGTVLAVGNAPSAIQTAGQFRVAARAEDALFDSTGGQLYVMADGIEVARHGEGPATHQNPLTAVGQTGRNGLFLQRNS